MEILNLLAIIASCVNFFFLMFVGYLIIELDLISVTSL
jgi:hypothetical protein